MTTIAGRGQRPVPPRKAATGAARPARTASTADSVWTGLDWADADDLDLAAAAGRGDRDAFAVIVARHGPAVLRYAARMLRHGADAEDVAQETLVAAWRGLPQFRGDSALRTWLFTLTARKVADLRRKRVPTPVDETGSGIEPPAIPGSADTLSQLLTDLDDALAALPWRQRACWVLCELEGLRYDEIAEVLQTTPTVVRGQLTRARADLRERMEAWR